MPCTFEGSESSVVVADPRRSKGYTLKVLRDRLRIHPQVDTTTGGLPYDVPKPCTEDEASSQRGTQVLSDCGLSELPSSIHSEVGDNRLYATFYLQTVMEEVETPIETEKSTNKTFYYMRAEKKDDTKTLKSKSYGRRSKRRWPMKKENLASMKEEFETKITHCSVTLTSSS